MGLGDIVPDDEVEDPQRLSEHRVVELLRDFFEEQGYQTTHDTNRTIDIIAWMDDQETWGIEVKGESVNGSPTTKIYKALGQILYGCDVEDVTNDDVYPAVAFPSTPDFIEQIENNVSCGILHALTISVIFVDENGVEIHEPGDIGTDD